MAFVRDMSLTGALLEVPGDDRHDVGDNVRVRLRGVDGTAIVRHRRPAGGDGVLLGVRFLPDPPLDAVLADAVGRLRGRSDHELEVAWQRPN